MMLLLLGCEADDAPGGHALSGTVTADRAGETGEVSPGAAFGYFTGGVVVIYVSPNSATTCGDVTTSLSGPGEGWDPTAVNAAGACSIFIRADYDGVAVEFVDEVVQATVSVNCAMDAGEWVQEADGYLYSGHWWQGQPAGYTLGLDGGADDLALGLEMSGYTGGFIYESMESAPASGEVRGTIAAQWCSDLGTTAFF